MCDFKLLPQTKWDLFSSEIVAAVKLFNCLLITNVRVYLVALAHSMYLIYYSCSVGDAKVTNEMQCQSTSTLQTASIILLLLHVYIIWWFNIWFCNLYGHCQIFSTITVHFILQCKVPLIIFRQPLQNFLFVAHYSLSLSLISNVCGLKPFLILLTSW